MARPARKSGAFNLRIVVLRRVQGAKRANGEYAETWPDPDFGSGEYFAARDNLTSGEQIVQGLRNSTGGMRLRIKGRNIPVSAHDRIRVKKTGEEYEVVGAHEDGIDTVLTVERKRGQAPVN